ncbi:MAG TPA: copper-binding protein [Anaerolineales bacterium]
MRLFLLGAFALGTMTPFPVLAVEAHHQPALMAAANTAELSEGEVRKVDREARKITIKHGPIQNLDMPPMTMVFQVKDAAMLDQVKAGDKVRFSAEKIGGQYTVIRLDPVK